MFYVTVMFQFILPIIIHIIATAHEVCLYIPIFIRVFEERRGLGTAVVKHINDRFNQNNFNFVCSTLYNLGIRYQFMTL